MALFEILKILENGFGAGNGGNNITVLTMLLTTYASGVASMYAFYRMMRLHKDGLLTGLLTGIVFIAAFFIAMLDMFCSYAMFSVKNAGFELIDMATELYDIRQIYQEGLILCASAFAIFVLYSLLEQRSGAEYHQKNIALRLLQNNVLEYCYIAVVALICIFGIKDIPLPGFLPISTWYSLFVYFGFAVTCKGMFIVFTILMAPIFSKHGNSAIKASEWLHDLPWLRSWMRRRAAARVWITFVFTAIIAACFIPGLKEVMWGYAFTVPASDSEARAQNQNLSGELVRLADPQVVYIKHAFWPDGADLLVINFHDIYTMLCKAYLEDTQARADQEIKVITGRLNWRTKGEQESALELLIADNPYLKIPPISYYYIDARDGASYGELYLVLVILSLFVLSLLYEIFAMVAPDFSRSMRRIRKEVPDIEKYLPRLKMELEDGQILYDGEGLQRGITITPSFMIDEGFMHIIPLSKILSVNTENGMGNSITVRIKLRNRSFTTALTGKGLSVLQKQMIKYSVDDESIYEA